VSARRSVMTDSPQHHRTLEEEDCDDNGANLPQDDIDNVKSEERNVEDGDIVSGDSGDILSSSLDSGNKKLINGS